MKFISLNKNMANGMRDTSGTPLTENEIEFIKSEINRIQADDTKFIFNDEGHLKKSTCYDYINDIIYVTRNVFPEMQYGSVHPRDIMSVAAVLAHEYYGHRSFRSEYMSDYVKYNKDYQTTPYWQDECRASITAAKLTPNLTEREKCDLINDAIFRAHEAHQVIEMDDFMKEVLYGYPSEKGISNPFEPIRYVSQSSIERIHREPKGNGEMPQMSKKSKSNDFPER